MIDASRFALRHNAFWMDHAPTSEHLVRRINLAYLQRWSPPLAKPAAGFRAAFVAECAFATFCGRLAGLAGTALDEEALRDARARLTPLVEDERLLDEPLSQDEDAQRYDMAAQMTRFFHQNGASIATRPTFRGCGYVDASEGDVIAGSTLFEVKAVDRPVRGIDLRQLLTYCALDYASRDHVVECVGVFNPRRGVFFQMEVGTLCREVSGGAPQELFDRVIHALSSGDISR